MDMCKEGCGGTPLNSDGCARRGHAMLQVVSSLQEEIRQLREASASGSPNGGSIGVGLGQATGSGAARPASPGFR
jgi:hypothetical protein